MFGERSLLNAIWKEVNIEFGFVCKRSHPLVIKMLLSLWGNYMVKGLMVQLWSPKLRSKLWQISPIHKQGVRYMTGQKSQRAMKLTRIPVIIHEESSNSHGGWH